MNMVPILALTVVSYVQAVAEPSTLKAAEPSTLKIEGCLTPHEMREAVEEQRAVQPLVALKAAGAAEKVRAQLCKTESGLVYLITTLGPNGHVSRVYVDATSGQRVGAR